MKKVIVLFTCLMAYFIMSISTGCDKVQTSDDIDRAKQERLTSEGAAEAGLPNIHNFTQKKLAKLIQEEQDKPDLVMFAYTFSEMSGKYIYLGKCIGYGLPYSTQYTNPQKTIEGSATGEFTTIAQADPNGLFMPGSSDGTWLMLIDPSTNKPRAVYIEPKIIVSPFKLPN